MGRLKTIARPSASHGIESARTWARYVTLVWLVACGQGEANAPDVARDDTPLARSDAPATDVSRPAPGPSAEQAGPTVVFLGDSISAGLHLRADQAFPAVVQRRLREQGVAIRLLNAGVSGDTTAGGARRVDWLLKQKPELVVVELGGNDGLRGVPLTEIEQNLKTILSKVRAAGARALLLGVRLPPSYGADYASGFEALYARVARELEVPLLPYFMEGVAGVAALNLDDGLHPTAEGHERLAARVLEALKPLVVAKGSAPASEAATN